MSQFSPFLIIIFLISTLSAQNNDELYDSYPSSNDRDVNSKAIIIPIVSIVGVAALLTTILVTKKKLAGTRDDLEECLVSAKKAFSLKDYQLAIKHSSELIDIYITESSNATKEKKEYYSMYNEAKKIIENSEKQIALEPQIDDNVAKNEHITNEDSIAVATLEKEISGNQITLDLDSINYLENLYRKKIDDLTGVSARRMRGVGYGAGSGSGFSDSQREIDMKPFKEKLDKVLYEWVNSCVSLFLKTNSSSISTYFKDSPQEINVKNKINSINEQLSKYATAKGKVIEYRNNVLKLEGSVSDGYNDDDIYIIIQGVQKNDMEQSLAKDDYLGLSTVFNEAFGGSKYRSVQGLKFIKKSITKKWVGGFQVNVPVYHYKIDPNGRKLLVQRQTNYNLLKDISQKKFNVLCSSIKGMDIPQDDKKIECLTNGLSDLSLSDENRDSATGLGVKVYKPDEMRLNRRRL